VQAGRARDGDRRRGIPLVLATGMNVGVGKSLNDRRDFSPGRAHFDEHTIESLAGEIEEELRTEGGEVGSDRIGVTVLERLRGLDHVAYLRFASVYKGFEDLADFEREVVELQKTTEPKRRLPN